jgi:hypothetical protein
MGLQRFCCCVGGGRADETSPSIYAAPEPKPEEAPAVKAAVAPELAPRKSVQAPDEGLSDGRSPSFCSARSEFSG